MANTLNKYILNFSFKGTEYYGWQLQPKSLSVQSVLNNALQLLMKEEVITCGAGRTDKGVHASFFIAHFCSAGELPDKDKNFIFRLNRILPKDIYVRSIQKTTNCFHARYSAIDRTYQYIVARTKSCFMKDFSTYIYGDLDLGSMQKAASILKEYNDFTSFARLHGSTGTNLCEITRSEWIEIDDYLIYKVTANRFLRNMVRSIAGTMLEIGIGKRKAEELRVIIEKKDRSFAGKSAEAKGLFLTGISYPEEYGIKVPKQEFPYFLIN